MRGQLTTLISNAHILAGTSIEVSRSFPGGVSAGTSPKSTNRLSHYMRVTPHSTALHDEISFPFHLPLMLQNFTQKKPFKTAKTIKLPLHNPFSFCVLENTPFFENITV